MKASAIAHPIQGIVKYHGLKSWSLRFPFHDSISVCTGPIKTHTTVELIDDPDGIGLLDAVTVDHEIVASGRAYDRIRSVLDEARRLADYPGHFRVVSKSDFPKYVGLGSSSSGFAALAEALNAALKLGLDREGVSALARLGAGSAARSVAGGLAEWVTTGDESVGRQLLAAEELDWAVTALVVGPGTVTEEAHRLAPESPHFETRNQVAGKRFVNGKNYASWIRGGATKEYRSEALVKLWMLAERETLDLHASLLTAGEGLIAWRGATVELMRACREWREGGVPVYFSVDTGATVYLNHPMSEADHVWDLLDGFLWSTKCDWTDRVRLVPGGGSRVVDEHLF